MSTAELPDFAAIAQEVKGAWPQIVACWEAFRIKYGLRLRADVGDTDQHGFLVEALGAAYAKRQLRALSDELEARGLVESGFAVMVKPFLGTGFALHSHVNGVWRVQYAAVGQAGMRRASRNVCRISIDGEHKGTGVLIRPNLVATAAHVVEPLVEVNGGASGGPPGWRVRPDSLARLAVLFSAQGDDDETDLPPVVAQLHEHWLVEFSGRAPLEGEGAAINDVAGIGACGPWDLAVIALYAPPENGPTALTQVATAVSSPSFGVHVLHHPAEALGNGRAMPLLWSIGEVREALGAPPPLRWLHTANTDGGSSGAPCFDNNWKLVALHQAGPHRITDAHQINRAVPVRAWADGIDGWATAVASVPFLAFVTDQAGGRVPVIGRRDVQTFSWRAMQSRASATGMAIIVRGDPGPARSLTVPIVEALAAPAQCRVAALDMRNAQADSAASFAQRVTGVLAAQLPEAALAPSRLTSTLRDVRNEVAPALMAELVTLAGEQQLWLVLSGFDEAALPDSSPVLQLVELILGGLPGAPGLRLVLTGWNGPSGAHSSRRCPIRPRQRSSIMY